MCPFSQTVLVFQTFVHKCNSNEFIQGCSLDFERGKPLGGKGRS